MNIAIAGSRNLPTGHAVRSLVRLLTRAPEDARILLRHPYGEGPTGEFEDGVGHVCDVLGLKVEWCEPDTPRTPGRAGVFARDIDMVAKADLVVVLLSERDAKDGYSGTMHVFEQALQQERPVYGFIVHASGVTTRWGEFDPDNLYEGLLE